MSGDHNVIPQLCGPSTNADNLHDRVERGNLLYNSTVLHPRSGHVDYPDNIFYILSKGRTKEGADDGRKAIY